MKIFDPILNNLIEKPQNFSTGLLHAGLLVGHDAEGGGQHKVTETTGRQDVLHPLLNTSDVDVESGGDHSAFINSADKVDYDFAGSVVVDDLKLADVSYKANGGTLENDGE